MAVPKGKVSSARQNKRRSNVVEASGSRAYEMPSVRRIQNTSQSLRQLRLLQRQSSREERCVICSERVERNAAMRSLLFRKKPYVDANGMALKCGRRRMRGNGGEN